MATIAERIKWLKHMSAAGHISGYLQELIDIVAELAEQPPLSAISTYTASAEEIRATVRPDTTHFDRRGDVRPDAVAKGPIIFPDTVAQGSIVRQHQPDAAIRQARAAAFREAADCCTERAELACGDAGSELQNAADELRQLADREAGT